MELPAGPVICGFPMKLPRVPLVEVPLALPIPVVCDAAVALPIPVGRDAAVELQVVPDGVNHTEWTVQYFRDPQAGRFPATERELAGFVLAMDPKVDRTIRRSSPGTGRGVFLQ
jgi:hypothetical protein